MTDNKITRPLVLVLVIIILIQLACSLGGNASEENSDTPDFAATEAALQATQEALDAQSQQKLSPTPEPLPTDTSPPPTEAPTTPPEPTEPQMEVFTSGDLIYFTDFDGPGDWEDGWIHFPVSEVELDYTVYKSDGYMHVEVPEEYSSVYLIYDQLYFERDLADVYVEAKFINMGTHNINNISVICRASDQGWYEFSMLSGGLWYIWKYSGDRYILLKDGGIPDLDYDAPHTIGAECLDNSLTFYFDGEVLRHGTTTDADFNEGQTGIAVYADDWADVVVEFDYFGISVP